MEAFLFPGQGSQRRGMGAALFDSDDFQEHKPQIDAILGYSLQSLCDEDPDHKLNQTRHTQPALYVVNYLSYRRATRAGGRPNYLAGHSLGEINALQAAGAFSFIAGLRIVQKRGEIMSSERGGAMAAIIGPSPCDVEDFLYSRSVTDVDIANYNSPSQTVVSGSTDAISNLEHLVKNIPGCMYFRLPVSAAFHSRYMKNAALEFKGYLGDFTFSELSIPVVSNATARPYPSGDITEAARALLSEHIVRPVRWADTIRHLHNCGVLKFTEIGPGNVLSKLNDQIMANA